MIDGSKLLSELKAWYLRHHYASTTRKYAEMMIELEKIVKDNANA